MASKQPKDGKTLCCEVCGVVGLSDKQLNQHVQESHFQDMSTCPFCDMVDPSPEVMMIHVNEAHLDYLSPQVSCIE